MKKKILSIVVIVCFMLTSSVICNAEVSSNISSDTQFYDLIDEINEEIDTLKAEKAIYYAAELYEIMDDVSEKLLIEEILNTSNTISTRTLILQISQKLSKDIDYNQFEYFLYDETEALELKENILINIFLNGGNQEILEKVINVDNGVLAFQALKYLYQIDSVSAINIADKIIELSEDEFGYKERAAVIIKSLDLRENSSQEDRMEFINYCDNVLMNNVNGEQVVLDTITYALSDMHSIEALDYIVSSDVIDDSAKTFCIKQNSEVLNEIDSISEINNTILIDNIENYIQENDSQNVSTNAIYPSNWAKGYAVYRDGAFGTYTWHAGLMNTTQISLSDSIIHIGGVSNVTKCNLYTFLDDGEDNFMGYYLPYRTISSELLNEVVNTARILTTRNIAYTPADQIVYSYLLVGTKVDPNEILQIRCDGVVEYCYEYLGIRIYGTDLGWDISKNNDATRAEHTLFFITPESQAKEYMVNMLGDVNCDRYPDATDANLVLQFAAVTEIPNTYQTFVSDVNADGIVNAEDARLILQYAAKIIDVFPGDPVVWDD